MKYGKRVMMTVWCLCVMAFVTGCSFQQRPYLDAAIQAANWLDASAVETVQGTYWPIDPANPAPSPTGIYHGTAGVVLFYLELYHTTNNPEYLAEAERGAAYIISRIPQTAPPPVAAGFYSGQSGVGFALEQLHQVTGEDIYRDYAIQCLDRITHSAQLKGEGVEWAGVTDIISGSAGIGLFLLYANREMEYKPARELAIKIGRRLIEKKINTEEGWRWAMNEAYESQNYFMPNFSHGTAGVCYFLAALEEATGDEEFLDGALAGAQHLAAIENDEGLLFHHEPAGEDLFYLNWCHGPVGTSRLYYKLWELTQNQQWLDKMQLPGGAMMHSGIPEEQTPGFWNNVGQCCGSAGLAEYYLNLHLTTGRMEYLDFARHATADLLARATPEGDGLKWISAEHRTQPDLLIAQTGYMQGAAGIGIWLLHLDAFEQGKKALIKLPDSPFEY